MIAVALPPVPTLDSALGVLSAMVTPAILIMACGSLILTTSSRLIRAIDRAREFIPQMEKLAAERDTDEMTEQQHAMVLDQLSKLTKRARYLQRALAQLYAALGVFVATSVAIGVIALSGMHFAWIPLVLGFIGAGLLFNASALLIIESRIALSATFAEMDYVAAIARRHHPNRI